MYHIKRLSLLFDIYWKDNHVQLCRRNWPAGGLVTLVCFKLDLHWLWRKDEWIHSIILSGWKTQFPQFNASCVDPCIYRQLHLILPWALFDIRLCALKYKKIKFYLRTKYTSSNTLCGISICTFVNSTQNVLPIHWKIGFTCNFVMIKILRVYIRFLTYNCAATVLSLRCHYALTMLSNRVAGCAVFEGSLPSRPQ